MAIFHFSLKSGRKGSAANHANYIARNGKYSNDESNDLKATAHGNLPDWAENDPVTFWRKADSYERANGAAYREYVVALPNELNLEQHRQVVQEFIEKEIGNKPYHYAIHDPQASIGGGQQPHAHVMYSDRLPDEFVRAPELHFKRYNSHDPELGGCKKDSGGKDRGSVREKLIEQRETWATILNTALEQSGHSDRVDHRSHRARGLVHAPEKHIGQYGVKKMSETEKSQLKQSRQRRADSPSPQ